jgi:hypothetical protein
MSRILHPLLLLAARAVYSQLVRENEFLKVENKILRSRVKDKVVPTPRERADIVRFGRELGAAIKKIISCTCLAPVRVFSFRERRPIGE